MNEHTVKVTDDTFADLVLGADRPVLVDFWAEWCGPCRLIAPILDDIAQEQEGQLLIAKLNIDENPVTTEQYKILSIPLLGLFKEGKLVKTVLGARPKASILLELEDELV
ncbi:thioredoxin [Actinoplanes sp. NPDC051411]|uniref:thioredoxin n=1 Tax=Actinoplanes sp. NPDC051411 TaxID=3155522 RepID=UPI00343FDC7C